MKINLLNNYFNFKGNLDEPYSRKEDGLGNHYGYIYQVRNKLTGDFFIGNTMKNPETRRKVIASHQSYAKILDSAIKSFGAHNFTFRVIDSAENKTELENKTNKLIKARDPKYNSTLYRDSISINSNGEIQKYIGLDSLPIDNSTKQTTFATRFFVSDENGIKPYDGKVWIDERKWHALSNVAKEELIIKAKQAIEDDRIIYIGQDGSITSFDSSKKLAEEVKTKAHIVLSNIDDFQNGTRFIRKSTWDKLTPFEKDEAIKKANSKKPPKTRAKINATALISIDANGNIKPIKRHPEDVDEITNNSNAVLACARGKNKTAINRCWITEKKYRDMTTENRKAFIGKSISDLRHPYVYLIRKDGSYNCYKNIDEMAEKTGISKRTIKTYTYNMLFHHSEQCYIARWDSLKRFYPKVYQKEVEGIKIKVV